MIPTLSISLDSHSARVIAGMLKSYAARLGDGELTGDMLIDQLVCDEIDQALKLREMLLNMVMAEKRRMAALCK